jgi:hypothetical protein
MAETWDEVPTFEFIQTGKGIDICIGTFVEHASSFILAMNAPLGGISASFNVSIPCQLICRAFILLSIRHSSTG